MSRFIGELYRAQELGTAPCSEPPEIKEAIEVVERVSRPGSRAASGGQGFGLTDTERAAVEKRAMDAAMVWLTENAFTVIRDVHISHSCDFLAIRGGVEHAIEVKGTTPGLGKVILTANEVALHQKTCPANLLIVVHNTELRELRALAVGGTVHVFDPFVIDDCVLVPLSYVCRLPH